MTMDRSEESWLKSPLGINGLNFVFRLFVCPVHTTLVYA